MRPGGKRQVVAQLVFVVDGRTDARTAANSGEPSAKIDPADTCDRLAAGNTELLVARETPNTRPVVDGVAYRDAAVGRTELVHQSRGECSGPSDLCAGCWPLGAAGKRSGQRSPRAQAFVSPD